MTRFSAGGRAAAQIALIHPDTFGNVLTQSGAFRESSGGDEPNASARAFLEAPRGSIRFYMEVGRYDDVPSARRVTTSRTAKWAAREPRPPSDTTLPGEGTGYFILRAACQLSTTFAVGLPMGTSNRKRCPSGVMVIVPGGRSKRSFGALT